MHDAFGFLLLWISFFCLRGISLALLSHPKTRNLSLILPSVAFGCAIVFAAVYCHDAYILPNDPRCDGIPVTDVMRLFMLDDLVTETQLKQGTFNSILFLAAAALELVVLAGIYLKNSIRKNK